MVLGGKLSALVVFVVKVVVDCYCLEIYNQNHLLDLAKKLPTPSTPPLHPAPHLLLHMFVVLLLYLNACLDIN